MVDAGHAGIRSSQEHSEREAGCRPHVRDLLRGLLHFGAHPPCNLAGEWLRNLDVVCIYVYVYIYIHTHTYKGTRNIPVVARLFDAEDVLSRRAWRTTRPGPAQRDEVSEEAQASPRAGKVLDLGHEQHPDGKDA